MDRLDPVYCQYCADDEEKCYCGKLKPAPTAAAEAQGGERRLCPCGYRNDDTTAPHYKAKCPLRAASASSVESAPIPEERWCRKLSHNSEVWVLQSEAESNLAAQEQELSSLRSEAFRLRAELVEIRHAYNFDMKRRDENDERREEEHTQTLINQQNNHQRQMGQLREKLSESKRECEEAKAQAGDWERVAKEWMRDYDRLKEKYEPMIAVTSEVSAARAEAARLRAALEKLTACCEDEAAFGVREVHPLVVEARAALRGSEEKGTEGEK